MRTPYSFKQAQKSVFQDKTFHCMKSMTVTGSIGSVTTQPDRKTRKKFTGNVQFVSDKMIAEEYGLRVGIDITVTSSESLGIKKGDYIEYGSELYRVTEAPEYDSYCAYYAIRERIL